MNKPIEQQIGEARDLMHHMIQIGCSTRMREHQERRINSLKEKLMRGE